jgi:hypothetical protein
MQLMHKTSLALAILMLGCLADTHSASAQTLTGSDLFSTNSGGSFSGVEVWTTAIQPSISRLWTYQGTTLVNASATDSRLNFSLTPGTYTFGIYGSNAQNYDFHGMNLFFDGQTSTPGISVKSNTLASALDTSLFTPNGGITLALDGNGYGNIPSADSLTFVDGTTTIQLTNFFWAKPSVYAVDRVSTYVAVPDGTSDFVGSYTLKVTNSSPVPEASTTISFGLLLCLGLGGLAIRARRRKAQSAK